MVYKGIARGKTIELDEALPYDEGQPVQVMIEPMDTKPPRGSAAAVSQAVQGRSQLTWEDVRQLEREIEAGRLQRGSPAAILQVLDRLPHVAPEVVDEFERAIEEGKLPVEDKGIFDDWK